MKKLFYIFVFMLAMLECTSIPAYAQQYELVDLGVIPGNVHSIAMDVNNNGDVLCVSDQQLFIWTNGVISPLALSTAAGSGCVMNNALTVVAFNKMWQGGSMTTLAFTGYGINQAGSIVGYSTACGFCGQEAVRDGVPLGVLFPGPYPSPQSLAYDINDIGQITGWATSGTTGEQRAFLWSNGTVTDLGTLGGNYANGWAINNHGSVVGISLLTSGSPHGFFWANGTMTDLGSLSSPQSEAYDINDFDQVVGWSGKAFIWQAGVMTDLNSLIPSGTGFVLETAEAINNLGWIVGRATYQQRNRAYLLKPVLATPTIRSTWSSIKAKYH